MKKNNKGFSLVELIVVIAILAFVGGAIIAFMLTSFRSYQRVNVDSTLANEVQLTMNRLENMIMDCQNGISYQYNGIMNSSDTSGFVLDDGEINGAVSINEKVLMVYDRDYRYIITYDKAQEKIFYEKQARILDPGAGTYSFSTGEKTELAAFIDDFQVGINKNKKETLVTVKVSMKKKDRTASADQSFALRNSLAINETDETVIYGEEAPGVPDTYEGIVVKANGMTFTKDTTDTCDVLAVTGKDLSIPFVATIKGTGFPSQEVIWEVTGSSSGAAITNGVLFVPAAESATTLYVTATSKFESGCTVTVTVNIMKITGISLTKGSGVYPQMFFDGATIALNSDLGLNARIEGSGNLSESMKAFHWVAVSNCVVSGSTMTIKGKVGDTFMIRVVSNQDASVMQEFSGTIVRQTLTLKITAKDDATTVNRGGSLKLTAKSVDGSTVYDTSEVDWAFSLNGADDGVSMSGSTVKVDTSLDYSTECYITVTATLKPEVAGDDVITSSIGLTVPQVQMLFRMNSGEEFKSSIEVSMFEAAIGSAVSFEYTLSGIEASGAAEIQWSVPDFDTYYGTDGQQHTGRVSIGDNTISIIRGNNDPSGVTGVPVIEGTELTGSLIKLITSCNIWISNEEQFYIPYEETNGWVEKSNYQYTVTGGINEGTQYYELELVTQSGTYRYKADNPWYWHWNPVQ